MFNICSWSCSLIPFPYSFCTSVLYSIFHQWVLPLPYALPGRVLSFSKPLFIRRTWWVGNEQTLIADSLQSIHDQACTTSFPQLVRENWRISIRTSLKWKQFCSNPEKPSSYLLQQLSPQMREVARFCRSAHSLQAHHSLSYGMMTFAVFAHSSFPTIF